MASAVNYVNYAAYDHPKLQSTLLTKNTEDHAEVTLMLENIHCGGCLRSCERGLQALPGVIDFQVNLTTRRGIVSWNPQQAKLSEILQKLDALGYPAQPYDSKRSETAHIQQRRKMLKQLAVAGFGMMQVMMFAVAMYAGEYQDMSTATQNFLRWMSLVVATPVVVYAAQSFFSNAWRGLKHWQLSMDVPVVIAISSAFTASIWATVSGSGEVYFDSVTMFTFLLLTGRYLEMNARAKAVANCETLAQLLPAVATKLQRGRQISIPVADLSPGDEILVRAGESIPADGTVINGRSSVDESLLTGESEPCGKTQGDKVIGGAINMASPLTLRIDRVGTDTVLAAMIKLLERAQTEKPRLARLADQVASWFVGILLIIAAGVFLYWWQYVPEQAFWITLAVLVVTCPCALSLATPAALAAASSALSRIGLLTTRAHALETLARTERIIFDKTGTLTYGKLQLNEIITCRDFSAERCLAIAAALEAESEHPIARAFAGSEQNQYQLIATEIHATPGQGIAGQIAGKSYRIGRLDYVQALNQAPLPDVKEQGETLVAVADEQGILAIFKLTDQLRPQAKEAVSALQTLGIDVEILSGDNAAAVKSIAQQLGIKNYRWQCTPEDKLQRLRDLQSQGVVVAMIGDGVNDAPVLAGAQISIAMGNGTDIARSNADMVLLNSTLKPLYYGVITARRTLTVIRQNLFWALVYNALALPLAASGLIAPWMAAIGMSASSLIVVFNALRLHRIPAIPVNPVSAANTTLQTDTENQAKPQLAQVSGV